MALLSADEELSRSRPGSAFSNGFEFEHWSSIWCDDCVFEPTCPLLELAMVQGVTPGPWEDRNPGALNRYHCHEFQRQPGAVQPCES